jgi:chromosome segregation ATPase
MQDDEFRIIEGRLYSHYRQLNEMEDIKDKVLVLENQLKQIENDMQNINFKIDPCLNMGIDYSRERIQTSSSGTSYVESSIEREITKLENEKDYKEKKIRKLKYRYRTLEEQTTTLSKNIGILNEEFKRFIEYKYDKQKSIRWIGEEMYQGVKSTAANRRKDILEEVYKFLKHSLFSRKSWTKDGHSLDKNM